MDIVDRLRDSAAWFQWDDDPFPQDFTQAADEIERLRAATGNLPPALVAKALAWVASRQQWVDFDEWDFDDAEIDQLRRANFEVHQ